MLKNICFPDVSDCRKRTHRKVNIKKLCSLVRNITSLLMSFFHFCSFCHKCQKPLFYTLCLLRHRSLPYLCTACFALPRLRPFSFVSSACRLYRHAETSVLQMFFFIYMPFCYCQISPLDVRKHLLWYQKPF